MEIIAFIIKIGLFPFFVDEFVSHFSLLQWYSNALSR